LRLRRKKALSPQALKLLGLFCELLGVSEEELSAFLKILRKARFVDVIWEFDKVEVKIRDVWSKGLCLYVTKKTEGIKTTMEVEI